MPRCTAAASVALAALAALAASTVASLSEEERETMLNECKETFIPRTEDNPPQNGEESKECFNTCLCEKMGLITAEGEMPTDMPEMMNETITQTQYDLLTKECNEKVKTAALCKKSPVMLECVKRVWATQSFPCFGAVP